MLRKPTTFLWSVTGYQLKSKKLFVSNNLNRTWDINVI